MGMDRRRFTKVLSGFSVGLFAGATSLRGAHAQELPEGVPDGSKKATVKEHIDGDKFKVEYEGDTETVLLISADAPEINDDKTECFGQEASDRLASLLPVGTVVYLEQDKDDRDGKDRLLRYAWLPREGKKAMFIDERMIADGYSTFKAREDNGKRDSRLKKAEETAKSKKRGMWAEGSCGGGHVEITPEPKLGSADKPAPLGTSLETDGQRFTLTSAFYTYDFGYSTPKGGYIFLVVEITIENIDDSNHGYDESRFSARDMVTGATFDDTFTLADAPLGSGELSPGEYVSGQAVLEVQETATQVRVKYDAKSLGGGEVYWLVPR